MPHSETSDGNDYERDKLPPSAQARIGLLRRIAKWAEGENPTGESWRREECRMCGEGLLSIDDGCEGFWWFGHALDCFVLQAKELSGDKGPAAELKRLRDQLSSITLEISCMMDEFARGRCELCKGNLAGDGFYPYGHLLNCIALRLWDAVEPADSKRYREREAAKKEASS